MNMQEARRTLHMCAYCGQQVEKWHWVYRGNLFCSGYCLMEFVGPCDSNYDEIVRTVRAREKVVPRAAAGEFSEANRFRGLDY